MRKIFILFAAAAALTTAACNTVSGVGRDATAAGQAVTGAAEDAKHKTPPSRPRSPPPRGWVEEGPPAPPRRRAFAICAACNAV